MSQPLAIFVLHMVSAPLALAFAPGSPGNSLSLAGQRSALSLWPVDNAARFGHRPMFSNSHGLIPADPQLRSFSRRTNPREGTKMKASSSSSIGLIKEGTQIGVGAAAIFAAERSLWALSKASGVWIPTAPAGMLLVFAVLLVIHAVSPKTAGRISDWFEPARTFYSKGVPLFFSPPLVQLPLSLGILPALSIGKYLAVITSGTIVSIIATGLAANALVSTSPETMPARADAPVGTATISTRTVVPRTSPVLKASVAASLIFAGVNRFACFLSTRLHAPIFSTP